MPSTTCGEELRMRWRDAHERCARQMPVLLHCSSMHMSGLGSTNHISCMHAQLVCEQIQTQ
eukprot:1581674-Alexandrium_andersonii.AAC.1